MSGRELDLLDDKVQTVSTTMDVSGKRSMQLVGSVLALQHDQRTTKIKHFYCASIDGPALARVG